MRKLDALQMKNATARIVFLFIISTQTAFANPVVDPNIKPQGANISTGTNGVNVNQTSPQAIIQWQSFNINKGETTHFVQTPSDVALNRINPQQGVSQIFGTLSGRGQIILINQAGIFFARGAQVNVGSLIASTSDITNKNFLAGKYIFDIHDPRFAGSIINQGTIIAAQHGLIALLATSIDNNGIIHATLGNVILASGNKFTVSFGNDELINFTIDEATAHGSINQSGTIKANGGKILITASAAEGIVDNVINMQGVLQAKSVAQQQGEIILLAQGGQVNVSGHIIASGQQGGTIKILAKNTHITSSAVIDATGKTNGGKVIVASSQPHSNPIADSSIIIDNGSLINASGYSAQGGKVIIHALNSTDLAGTILVQGGLAGNGGTIKVLGKDIHIAATGTLIATGNTGGGTILIGGNEHGKGPETNATNTTVAKGSTINASALQSGNGGKVIVWSNNKTDFVGMILALGGAKSGNGGFVEISGKHLKISDKPADLTAPNGTTGTLLLDPENLIIQTADPTTATPTGNPTNTYTSNGDSSILTVAELQSALTSANVIVQTGSTGKQSGNIIVANSITWNNTNTLVLSAYLNVIIKANISNAAGGSLIVNADNTRTGNGTIMFDGGSVNISGGGKVNFFYSPPIFPSQTTFSNNVNVSGGTTYSSTSFVNNLTNGFVTALNPITPFNSPQIEELLKNIEQTLPATAPSVTIAIADTYREIQAAHPKEVSSQVTCENVHNDVCGALTFE